jgi:hypothetical protein
MRNFLSVKKIHRQFYSQKIFKSAEDAVKDIKDGSKILVGGFGKKKFKILKPRTLWNTTKIN